MKRRHQYVRNCTTFLASGLPASTWTLLEMQEALLADLDERPTVGERRREQLAEIQRRLDRAADYAVEHQRFERERAALASSLVLRLARYRHGSESPRYQALLQRRLCRLAEAEA